MSHQTHWGLAEGERILTNCDGDFASFPKPLDNLDERKVSKTKQWIVRALNDYDDLLFENRDLLIRNRALQEEVTRLKEQTSEDEKELRTRQQRIDKLEEELKTHE